MNEIQRPLPESYWVEYGHFLAGEYPGHYDAGQARRRIDALLEAGFNTFIDLTKANEVYPYQEILKEQAGAYNVDAQYYRFPIGDFGLPTHEQTKAILDQIDETLRAGRSLYLHCWGGIGRTGTAVGCYLVRHGLEGDEEVVFSTIEVEAVAPPVMPGATSSASVTVTVMDWTEVLPLASIAWTSTT